MMRRQAAQLCTQIPRAKAGAARLCRLQMF
jgi:hypothetical protein